MKISKKTMMIAALSWMMAVSSAGLVFGAVTAQEAAQLGKNLTLFGSEKAGNKEGTIPAYTGGLTTAPASYKPGSGRYTDPFAGEKPLFSINAQNMNQHADKLAEGSKALMKKYPAYRIDVYKTHRTVAYPDWMLKNTAKCAVTAKSGEGGLAIDNARACIPFPIPKTGPEVMWNHLTAYRGLADETKASNYIKDSNGRLTCSGGGWIVNEYPFWTENPDSVDKPYYWKYFYSFQGKQIPSRLVGNLYLAFYPINQAKTDTMTYVYLPGQRRVRLAPEIDFDTPLPDAAGQAICDETFGFTGSMEKYNWKLLGKKEMYIPYNDYRADFSVPFENLLMKGYLNPDYIRWELHRVWIVEANLKKGDRHIYPKRKFYIDEDSWRIHAAETYDALGTLSKVDYTLLFQAYDALTPFNDSWWNANLVSGTVHAAIVFGPEGKLKYVKTRPTKFFSPETMTDKTLR
jgi:hypothetical protein